MLAAGAGDEDRASALRTSLEEDEASAEVADGIIETVTREHLKLATGGPKTDS